MARRKRQTIASGGSEDDVNLTPMLDVVFILLIFFIVTAQFIKEPGAIIDRQDVENDQSVKRLGILIAIDEDSKIWIDKTPVEPEEVEYLIRELRKDNPKGKIVVQTDKNSEARELVSLLETIGEIEGLQPVDISTKRD